MMIPRRILAWRDLRLEVVRFRKEWFVFSFSAVSFFDSMRG